MKPITDILEQVRETILRTQQLAPMLFIDYKTKEEVLPFAFGSYPRLDKVDEFYVNLGKQKRKEHPSDQLCRLCLVSKASLWLENKRQEAMVVILLDIDMVKRTLKQKCFINKVVRSGGAIRALVSVEEEGAILNHLLLSFLLGFVGEGAFVGYRDAVKAIIISKSERQ